MMKDIYLNILKNNWLHSYGMRMDTSVAFLPREPFLTECKKHDMKAALPSAEKLQNELLNFEKEHGKR